VLRARRSSRVTSSVSPGPMTARAWANARRSERAPLIFSLKIFVAPADAGVSDNQAGLMRLNYATLKAPDFLGSISVAQLFNRATEKLTAFAPPHQLHRARAANFSPIRSNAPSVRLSRSTIFINWAQVS
jgi:hypothetical protein